MSPKGLVLNGLTFSVHTFELDIVGGQTRYQWCSVSWVMVFFLRWWQRFVSDRRQFLFFAGQQSIMKISLLYNAPFQRRNRYVRKRNISYEQSAKKQWNQIDWVETHPQNIRRVHWVEVARLKEDAGQTSFGRRAQGNVVLHIVHTPTSYGSVGLN